MVKTNFMINLAKDLLNIIFNFIISHFLINSKINKNLKPAIENHARNNESFFYQSNHVMFNNFNYPTKFKFLTLRLSSIKKRMLVWPRNSNIMTFH
ncbi:hypothetical protein AL552_07860 [Vibrio diabolicus]|nr:hypothetical protein AL552_07860 [Vibrio diabolicus]